VTPKGTGIRKPKVSSMLRVLVVDDSPTARALIAAILVDDDELIVAGQAGSGDEAVRLTAELRPDVITMDIHMPGMSGFEATKQIMIATPTPIVIVSSSTTIAEVATGMRALRAGALTLLRKPPGPDSANYESACVELVDTVKSMADVKVVRHFRLDAVEPTMTTVDGLATCGAPADAEISIPPSVQFENPRGNDSALQGIVALAASTGGPPAIQRVLSELPVEFPLPILVVQHIAKGFAEGFANWLDATVPLPVVTAQAGVTLRAGHVYVAPEDRHLGVTPMRVIELSAAPTLGGFRPSASYLFNSVAGVYRDAVFAVIMTGMGSDGVDGLRTVKKHGGTVIAQDKATSVVFGMPEAALSAHVVDETVGLDQIAARVRRFAQRRT